MVCRLCPSLSLRRDALEIGVWGSEDRPEGVGSKSVKRFDLLKIFEDTKRARGRNHLTKLSRRRGVKALMEVPPCNHC